MKTCTFSQLAGACADGATVVDVREPDEYVPGAVLIPLGQLPHRTNEVPRSSRVFVICASGRRSRTGASVLEAAGIDAISVEGGTDGWIADGREYVTGPRAR